MPETQSEVHIDSDQRDYAQTLKEMERGLSIFGKITGMTDDLKEVSKELPYNFRQPFNIVKAMFRLEPGLYTLHTGMDSDIQIGFRIEPAESDSMDEMPSTAAKTSTTTDNSFYHNRILRLEGELHDADRRIRQQVDEIMTLKRELAEDKTATLLTHQKELSELRETHRNEIDRLKETHRQDFKDLEKELGELEKIKFRMEMEQRAGGRDAGSRLLDMLEENVPMFCTVASQLFAAKSAGSVAGSPGPVAPISEEEAAALAASLRQELPDNAAGDTQQPNSPLNDEANPSKGAGKNPSFRHLPAEGDEETLNGRFAPEQRNGHGNPTITN